MTKKFFQYPVKAEFQTTVNSSKNPAQFNAFDLANCSTEEGRSLLDYKFAEQFQVLPLGIIGGELVTIASKSSEDEELEKSLKFAIGKSVKLIEVPKEILREAIFFAYNGGDLKLENLSKDLGQIEKEPLETKNLPFRQFTGGAAGFLVALIDYAISNKASDIHLIPILNGSIIKLRIDGVLRENKDSLSSIHVHNQIIGRLKALTSLDTAQKKLPQDGSFSILVSEKRVNLRLSLMPTIHGEKAVIRILGTGKTLGLRELGIEQKTYEYLKDFINAENGTILVSGPTGGGKTTTLYALLAELTNKNLNIVSIEDPVEIEVEGISQTSVSESVGLTFSKALRSILRQDPDVILIGELRDSESAAIAFEAASTGHKVLASIHAKNVIDTFRRLENFNLLSEKIISNLNLIVNQRLIPLLCNKCKVIDLNLSKKYSANICQSTGCNICDYSGFSGRELLTEALKINFKLREKIHKGSINVSDLSGLFDELEYSGYRDKINYLFFNGLISHDCFLAYSKPYD